MGEIFSDHFHSTNPRALSDGYNLAMDGTVTKIIIDPHSGRVQFEMVEGWVI